MNIPIKPQGYLRNRHRVIDFFNMQPKVSFSLLNHLKLFVIDGYAGDDPAYRKACRIICTRPYHALFMKNMLLRDNEAALKRAFSNGPDFTVLNGGEFYADPSTEDVRSKTSVNVNFSLKEMVILGTQYAGEMKKGIFGVMHYYMPEQGALTMHASANLGSDNTTTVLFGLSGTGKTTLSADPQRQLIGDDEHVWCSNGIFNIEGGCYAKAVGLKAENEPEIFNAIRFGAVVENTMYEGLEKPRTVNYDDTSLTENTRVCYPLEHIDNVKLPPRGGHPKNIIFLTCDANGVLPPVAKLSFEQAKYHFVSGYTAKVAGTEMGIVEPEATFSACFGEAFLPRHPYTYAKMLEEMVDKYDSKVWLVNTGWSGGKYGVGSRMSLKITRRILDNIHSGALDNCDYETIPGFGFNVPKNIGGIDPNILNPINSWRDKEEFKFESRKLAEKFVNNFKKYEDGTPRETIEKGGPNLSEM